MILNSFLCCSARLWLKYCQCGHKITIQSIKTIMFYKVLFIKVCISTYVYDHLINKYIFWISLFISWYFVEENMLLFDDARTTKPDRKLLQSLSGRGARENRVAMKSCEKLWCSRPLCLTSDGCSYWRCMKRSRSSSSSRSSTWFMFQFGYPGAPSNTKPRFRLYELSCITAQLSEI